MFKSGVRVLMLIDRSVGNTSKGSRRWVNKIVSTNAEEWDAAYERLRNQLEASSNIGLRLYSSVNSRKIDKAIKLFQHKQLDLIDDNRDRFYVDINNSFVSCLMKPECREYNYFLLDIDCEDDGEAHELCAKHEIRIFRRYLTPNGWHFITEPFAPSMAGDCQTFEIKKDALMLHGWK